MQITLNGEPFQLQENCNLTELIELLSLTDKRIAVELNQSIIARSNYAQTTLAENDQVEIVQAIGGG